MKQSFELILDKSSIPPFVLVDVCLKKKKKNSAERFSLGAYRFTAEFPSLVLTPSMPGLHYAQRQRSQR